MKAESLNCTIQFDDLHGSAVVIALAHAPAALERGIAVLMLHSTSSIRHGHTTAQRRCGVILIIVVACLALFLALGLAFVFYANQQAISMRIHREASHGGRTAYVNQGTRGPADEAPPLALDLFNMAMSQLIYDVPETESGHYSAMRGHSLARSMYGYRPGAENFTPFNGYGRIRQPSTKVSGLDEFDMINYTRFSGDDFVRYPERESGVDRLRPGYFIAKNAPYTYPDENNCFLAAVRSSDGKVLVPSFHRPWLVGPLSGSAWKNPKNKYLMLRPHPSEHPEFRDPLPNPDGSFGDVENLEGKLQHQHDSVWIDIDAPVHSWRGRFYKPLFAFLIVDLDGRFNLNIAGNRGRGAALASSTQTSHQGLGPWEMDIDHVLGIGKSTAVLKRRYSGNGQPTARYSLDGGPRNYAPWFGNGGAFHTGINFDHFGSSPFSVPLPRYQTSPTLNSIYWNGFGDERLNHSSLYNPYFSFRTTDPSPTWEHDKYFGAEEMYSLNNKFYADTVNYAKSSLAVTAGLTDSIMSPNKRFMVTTISNDVQRPGARPWRPLEPANRYRQANADVLPTGGPINAPAPGTTVAEEASDFDSTWRSVIASTLASIDLNRKLTDYRTDPSNNPQSDANRNYESIISGSANGGGANFNRAQADRQALAKDIFDRLMGATGVRPLPSVPLPTADDEYNACRRLAQIAVNIVDLLDLDDYITPFNWNDKFNDVTNPDHLRKGWVFGTEIPRLVINEVYAGWDNEPTNLQNPKIDPTTRKPYADKPYKLQIYAELHNPLTPGGAIPFSVKTQPYYYSHSGGAPLVFKDGARTWDVYQLVVTNQTNTQKLAAIDNALGDVDNPNDPSVTTVGSLGDVNAANKGVVPISNRSAGRNPSFHLVGPKNVVNQQATLPGNDAKPLSQECPKLSIDIPLGNQPRAQMLLLRRLLCPHRAPGADNPYVTVDHVQIPTDRIYDHRQYVTLVEGGNNPAKVKYGQHHSYGRNQPYDATPVSSIRQGAPRDADDYINHSVVKHNDGAKDSFDWLVHLDRTLISPAEISCVSAWKPHELTQRFVRNGVPQQHLANWFDNEQRLFRAFSLLDVRSRNYGMPFGGRLPGRMNLNTMYDRAVLDALVDRAGENLFSAYDVDSLWNRISGSRLIGATGSNGMLSAWASARPLTEKPILPPLGANYTDGNDLHYKNQGVNDTFLPAALTNNPNPLLRLEMLSKLYNNVTTRSNTYVVWCTIGYFEVKNAGPYSASNRPILGKELGIDDGTNIRHKFFSLIDRSNLTIDTTTATADRFLQGDRAVFLSFEPTTDDLWKADPPKGPQRVRIPATALTGSGALQGTYDGTTWTITANDEILLGFGLDEEERVKVTKVVFHSPATGGDIEFTTVKPHYRGAPMQLNWRKSKLGNPGPQPGFNFKDLRYTPIIRYITKYD